MTKIFRAQITNSRCVKRFSGTKLSVESLLRVSILITDQSLDHGTAEYHGWIGIMIADNLVAIETNHISVKSLEVLKAWFWCDIQSRVTNNLHYLPKHHHGQNNN